MRFLLTFIAGGVFALTVAITWMPRAAWVELLDHVEFGAEERVMLTHGRYNNFDATGFVPYPYLFPGAQEIMPREEGEPSLYFLSQKPLFQLMARDVESICESYGEVPTIVRTGKKQFHIRMSDSAQKRFFDAVTEYADGKLVSEEIRVEGFDGIQLGITYTTTAAIKDYARQDEDYFLTVSWEEPFLARGTSLISALSGGKTIGKCAPHS